MFSKSDKPKELKSSLMASKNGLFVATKATGVTAKSTPLKGVGAKLQSKGNTSIVKTKPTGVGNISGKVGGVAKKFTTNTAGMAHTPKPRTPR